jgi:cell division septal protein FtsQ
MQRASPVYQSNKLREKKRRTRKLSLIGGAILFILVLAGLVYVTHHPSIRIEKIIVSDLRYTDRAAVEGLINQQLNGQYIGLFSKANTLTFPRAQIKQVVLREYPAIKSISFEWRDRNVIAIRLAEHTPVAIWCDTPVTPATALAHADDEKITGALPQVIARPRDAACFFVNENAMLFAPVTGATDTEGLVALYGRIIKDPIRQTYTDKTEFTDLLDFVRLVRRLEIVVTEIWTTSGEAYSFVAQSGTQLYVDSEDNIIEVFDNLKTVIARDAINKAQFANIKYIDLRFGNRVFYKLR